jgi:hypothetical protein
MYEILYVERQREGDVKWTALLRRTTGMLLWKKTETFRAVSHEKDGMFWRWATFPGNPPLGVEHLLHDIVEFMRRERMTSYGSKVSDPTSF